MADKTKIEWTDATWNPITGCSVVSPGCTNCYAMRLAGTRLKHHPSRAGLTRDTKARGVEAEGRQGSKKGHPVWTGEVRFNRQWLDQPLRWTKPRMIFVCAHGDLFAEGVPDEWLDRIFAVMALCPQHTFQVLTKRPERMREYLTQPGRIPSIYEQACDRVIDEQLPVVLLAPGIADPGLQHAWPRVHLGKWPLPNVWLGVSCEDQRRADERVPILLDTPAAIRWVSAEPLLGPIDFTRIDINGQREWDVLQSYISYPTTTPGVRHYEPANWPSLDWIVAGGESGPGSRPMHPAWVRSIRDQCAAAGVPFLFKQWGAWAPVCEMDEDQIDRCYRPAPEQYPEATRACLVDQHVLHIDGSRHGIVDRMAFLQGTGAMTMMNIGKTRAGRLLDGAEHNGFPETRQ